MRKDESGVSEWCKHTRNAGGKGGRRMVNKRVRKNVKRQLQKRGT
jgi:hypothetical protein